MSIADKFARKKNKQNRNVELHPDDVDLKSKRAQMREDIFRFSVRIDHLLQEAKRKEAQAPDPKVRKDGSEDKRSPVVKSILQPSRYPNTQGMHPTKYRIFKQIQKLNGKSRVTTTPLTQTSITQPNRFVKEEKEMVTENVRGHSSQSKPRSSHPSNKDLTRTAGKSVKSAKKLARDKLSSLKTKEYYSQKAAENKAVIGQISRIK